MLNYTVNCNGFTHDYKNNDKSNMMMVPLLLLLLMMMMTLQMMYVTFRFIFIVDFLPFLLLDFADILTPVQ